LINLVSLASVALIGVLLLLISIFHNVYAITNVSSPYFSIQVPNDWIYRENFLNQGNIVLTPNEFAELLMADNTSASVLDVIEHGIVAELGLDADFNKKNASLEKYVKYFLSFAQNYDPKYENATIGGERAIKVFINGTDVGRTSPMKNVTSSINSISYLVMHQNHPYYLYYIANANDYNKYLPYFEQMVKTFKFAK
jgi:hypothetical protein